MEMREIDNVMNPKNVQTMIAAREAADQARERAATKQEELAKAQRALKSAEQERDKLSSELEADAAAAAQASALARREGQTAPKPRVEALQKRIALEQLDNEVELLAQDVKEARRAHDSAVRQAKAAASEIDAAAVRVAYAELFELEGELRKRLTRVLAFAEISAPKPTRKGFTLQIHDAYSDPHQGLRNAGKHRGAFELLISFDQVSHSEVEAARCEVLEAGNTEPIPTTEDHAA